MLKANIHSLINRGAGALQYLYYKLICRIRLAPEMRDLPRAEFAAEKLLRDYNFETLLDVGSGGGEHSELFAKKGIHVTSVDFGESVYYKRHVVGVSFAKGDYYEMSFPEPFDVVWASHVLEHQPNPGQFIRKLFHDCKDGGLVCITVPPLKHDIVGGHLTLWNAGLLLYHVVFAGYDCRNASVLRYGYNISVIIRKTPIVDPPQLTYDSGDIDRLKDYFPPGITEPFDGRLSKLNW